MQVSVFCSLEERILNFDGRKLKKEKNSYRVGKGPWEQGVRQQEKCRICKNMTPIAGKGGTT